MESDAYYYLRWGLPSITTTLKELDMNKLKKFNLLGANANIRILKDL
jgi:Iap family predicted aminopeptidase